MYFIKREEHTMSSTKELLIKIKDAAYNVALPVNDIPIDDIKEAVLAEYTNNANNTTAYQTHLAELQDTIMSIDNTEKNLNNILLFLDSMINHMIYLENYDNLYNKSSLPDNIEPDDEYQYYLNLADYYSAFSSKQCCLCLENAYYHCKDTITKSLLFNKMNTYRKEHDIHINKISIIIVSYNNCYITQQCIYSIRKYCYSGSYEIIVVDNASTDGVTEWLEQQQDIKLIKSSCNLGFPKGCNVGIANSDKNNDIFLLNNDTRLTPNALFWLRMGLYESENTGAAGAVSNYAALLQYINLFYGSIDDYQRFGFVNNIFKDNPFESCTFLSGFAMLIKRSALNKTTLLDEELSPGYYDDDDISFQLLNKGFLLKVCHNSFIYHAGSQSFNQINSDKIQLIYQKNREYLTDKWGFSPDSVRVNTGLPDYIKSSDPDTLINIMELNAHNGTNYGHLKYVHSNINYIGLEQNSAYLKCSINGSNIIHADYFNFDYSVYAGSIDYIIISQYNIFTDTEKDLLHTILQPVLKPTGQILSIIDQPDNN